MSDLEHHDFGRQLKVYQAVLGALLLLTGITWGIAYIDMGGTMNTIVALSIAVFKATIVVLLFMHVKAASTMVKLTVCAGVFWLMILFGMLLMDFVARKGDWVKNGPGTDWF